MTPEEGSQRTNAEHIHFNSKEQVIGEAADRLDKLWLEMRDGGGARDFWAEAKDFISLDHFPSYFFL